MERILLVEDDEALARGIVMALAAPEREIQSAASVREARVALSATLDLIILDIKLPDGNGLDLLRALRAEGVQTPVILLTANDMEMDEVVGLEAGANDYITKPFSLAVLRARVAVQLRGGKQTASARMVMGPFDFDFEGMVFRRDGVPIELSKSEQKLLRILVDNRGHTVTRDTLVERVWSDGAAFVDENALSVTVKRLRKKLEVDPSHPMYLKTVYGLGYTWAVPS